MLPVDASVSLEKLVEWCDGVLQTSQFKDYCPNGLQVHGGSLDRIRSIATAVTASEQAIDEAIARKVNALIVHHGYFWKGEEQTITGMKSKRIKKLHQYDIALLAYHLPLDAHPLLGNNVALADLLGIQITGALDPKDTFPIGNVGVLNEAHTPREFNSLITESLKRTPLHFDFGPFNIKKVGICTGAAQDFLIKAVEAGCDAYISGEVSERTYHEAKELGIHYFACGHHATERYGIQRLGEAIKQQFHVKHHYIELDNPV